MNFFTPLKKVTLTIAAMSFVLVSNALPTSQQELTIVEIRNSYTNDLVITFKNAPTYSEGFEQCSWNKDVMSALHD
ncbi:MAG: hypothetical protein SVC26_08515 [Pseudomonadota bacterium]|nr:hypothetical protein [Pseudomonadota bacterium]